MADEDIQRLIVTVEAKLAAYDKALAKMPGTMEAAMKKVVNNVGSGMRNVETTAAQSGMRIQASLGKAVAGIKDELLNSVAGLQGRTGAIGGAFSKMGAAGAAAATGLGALVVVFTLLSVKGREALKSADDIGDAAAKLGVSAESLQELRAVFNGLVDPAQVDAGLGKLTTQIGLASAGVPKAQKVFKALNIDLRDSAGAVKTPLAVYLELADRIAALKSPAQQAAAAQKALGDAGIEQLPILKQGSAAIKEMIASYRDMGAIIPEDVINKAGELQQKLDDLSLVMKAQLTTALVDAGPAIVELAQQFAAHLPGAIKATTAAVKFLADNLKPLAVIFGALAGASAGSIVPGFGTIVGAIAGGTAAYVAFGQLASAAGDDVETSSIQIAGSARMIAQAEQTHIDTLNTLADIYDEMKGASADRVKALEAEQKAIIDKAGAEELAAAKAKLASATEARDALSKTQLTGPATMFDPKAMGKEFIATTNLKAAQDLVDTLTKKVSDLQAAAQGTVHLFDPATASVDELVQHLGKIDLSQITQSQADMLGTNDAVKALVSSFEDAEGQTSAFEEQYVGLLHQLSDASGWDTGSTQMAMFITRAAAVVAQLDEMKTPATEADAAMQILLADFGVPVSASAIVAEIARIKNAMDDMGAKAATAWEALRSKLGSGLANFLTGNGGATVVPNNAGIPRARPPAGPIRPGRGTADLGDLGGAGGAGSKSKAPKDPALETYLKQLQTEVENLHLSGVALKENQLLTEAATKAKADFANKVKDAHGALRESAKLTDAETATIKAQAAVLAGVPDILSIAKDKLPAFNLDTQIKNLTELQGLLTNPDVVKALEAQGLTAEQATKAINAQIASVTDTAHGTSEAIQGIGDALVSGIQSATSFEDALLKIGVALAQMIAQAVLFGQGPLGKTSDSWLGVVGGLIGNLAGLGSALSGGNVAQGVINGTGFRRSSAVGGYLQAGEASWVNEAGQEAARRGQDLFIPGKATQIIPAAATRQMVGGAANSNAPITIVVAGATGNQEVRQMIAAGVSEGVKQSGQNVPTQQRNYQLRFGR